MKFRIGPTRPSAFGSQMWTSTSCAHLARHVTIVLAGMLLSHSCPECSSLHKLHHSSPVHCVGQRLRPVLVHFCMAVDLPDHVTGLKEALWPMSMNHNIVLTSLASYCSLPSAWACAHTSRTSCSGRGLSPSATAHPSWRCPDLYLPPYSTWLIWGLGRRPSCALMMARCTMKHCPHLPAMVASLGALDGLDLDVSFMSWHLSRRSASSVGLRWLGLVWPSECCH